MTLIETMERWGELSAPLRNLCAQLDAQPEGKPITELPRLRSAPVINVNVTVSTEKSE